MVTPDDHYWQDTLKAVLEGTQPADGGGVGANAGVGTDAGTGHINKASLAKMSNAGQKKQKRKKRGKKVLVLNTGLWDVAYGNLDKYRDRLVSMSMLLVVCTSMVLHSAGPQCFIRGGLLKRLEEFIKIVYDDVETLSFACPRTLNPPIVLSPTNPG
jgi:hypothetical protein